MSRPFWNSIVHVDHMRAVKDMAGWFECVRNPAFPSKVKECWKGQPHPPSFISNQSAAQRTADFTGQNPFVAVQFTVVEMKVFQSGCKAHIFFMKDGCPLHGSTVQLLTGHAVADFTVHGIGRDFIAHGPAMAARLIFYLKISIFDGRILGSKTVFHVTFLKMVIYTQFGVK